MSYEFASQAVRRIFHRRRRSGSPPPHGYALMWTENADLVATFKEYDEAVEALTSWVLDHPGIREKVALHRLKDGRGTGCWIHVGEDGSLVQVDLRAPSEAARKAERKGEQA